MDRNVMERIDAFPYSQRVGEAMGRPPATIEADAGLQAAAQRLRQRDVSALVICDEAGRPEAILTERDLVKALAAGDLSVRAGVIASRPVSSIGPDAFLYTAIARMDRLGLRHLAVVDPRDGRLLGVLSQRALLRQRAGAALAIGDEIAAAPDGPAMRVIHDKLPSLARGMLGEGLGVLEVAALISAVLRDLSARAAELAAATLAADGQGAAPGPWCFLVLGSGGRGESLLAADQDNALVFESDAAANDPWFAALGRHAADLLDQAGIPYCKGKVMASEPAMRRSLAGWQAELDRWAALPDEQSLLAVDIFYDFRPVYGDHGLADKLRLAAMKAAKSPLLLARLGQNLEDGGSPFGFFGGFKTEGGRLDLKIGGSLPIVAGARVLALKIGATQLDTPGRLRAAAEAGLINANDLEALLEAVPCLLGAILEQQIEDIAARLAPSTKVELARLSRLERQKLKRALEQVKLLPMIVKDAIAG